MPLWLASHASPQEGSDPPQIFTSCAAAAAAADPDVRADMETFLNRVVPEGRGAPWIHTDEGACPPVLTWVLGCRTARVRGWACPPLAPLPARSP
jgi:hypothetical protein